MDEKRMIWLAKGVSVLFTPFALPVVGEAVLFVFSYLNVLPLKYRLAVLGLVAVFTMMLPTMLIRLYRKSQGWTRWQLGRRERRAVPYVISIICYLTCYYLMTVRHMPGVMRSILMAALLVQVLCALINTWWKISIHSAAIGGVTGGLLAFSLLFNFNPLWWLCLVLLLAGMVGTSRMILRQHTLTQVTGGYFVGLAVAFVTIIMI